MPNATLLLASLGYTDLPWQANLLICVWLWCLGANLGSFMNVVVFRLPAGRSVATPRSRCPACGAGIAWYDNVPVLSWLILGARCRRCSAPISARYPIVEATVAAAFVVLGLFSPMTSGANLPAPPPGLLLRLQSAYTLWVMYGGHMLLVCTLVCAALIRFDRHLPPGRLFVPAMFFPLAATLVWSQLRPVPYAVSAGGAPIGNAIVESLAGLAVGATLALIGWACWRVSAVRSAAMAHRWTATDVLAGGAVGLMLGWQAAAALIPAAAAAHLAGLQLRHTLPALARWPWTGHLCWGTPAFIILWSPLVDLAPWLGGEATVATFAAAAATTGALVWLAVATARAPVPGPVPDVPCPSPMRTADVQDLPADTDPGVRRILESPSYRLAELDTEFLQRSELRPVRLQLELLKPEMILAEQGVHSTIVTFGGTQILTHEEALAQLQHAREELDQFPDDAQRRRVVDRAERILAKSHYYDAARQFSRLVSSSCQLDGDCDYVIVTGGGPGIMEAANRGAHDVRAKSAGLNITLPEEQAPNPYITPELCFQFHYFALRKMHFLFRAKALVVFPGGFGTLDELFDALTLRQTQRMQEIPIILYGREYWAQVIDFRFLADEGVIRDEHLDLIQYAETPQEAWEQITRFHSR